MAITACTDVNIARQYLEMSGHQLEMAVSLFMDHNVGGGGGTGQDGKGRDLELGSDANQIDPTAVNPIEEKVDNTSEIKNSTKSANEIMNETDEPMNEDENAAIDDDEEEDDDGIVFGRKNSLRRTMLDLTGVNFPVRRLHRELKSKSGLRVGMEAAVFTGSTLEYLTSEVLELSASIAR